MCAANVQLSAGPTLMALCFGLMVLAMGILMIWRRHSCQDHPEDAAAHLEPANAPLEDAAWADDYAPQGPAQGPPVR